MPTLPVVAILLSVLPGPVPAIDAPTPPPTDHIVIDVVTVNGSSCPAGTAAVATTSDNSAFEVTYALPPLPPATPTDMRKNCQLSLVVHVPAGYTYGIRAADHRGFARLGSGSSAVHRSNFFFTGGPAPSWFTHPLAGPMNDDEWQATDTVDPAGVVYAPCGQPRNLNLNNDIRLSAGGSSPSPTDVVILDTSTYHLQWQRCPVPLGGRR